ncbi:hypothetical protein NC653_021933 [Populus alba x Populus x berolinensis]|uniref:Uncharacterized protein n=1 Tax=Populus alba x Populus x berolinensis TaxID=444605 RepID=A0AAD6QF37_9ROSI|nr:hypothetical protein NC653_021933 [Populus alba x Populus x berolinensis]
MGGIEPPRHRGELVRVVEEEELKLVILERFLILRSLDDDIYSLPAPRSRRPPGHFYPNLNQRIIWIAMNDMYGVSCNDAD